MSERWGVPIPKTIYGLIAVAPDGTESDYSEFGTPRTDQIQVGELLNLPDPPQSSRRSWSSNGRWTWLC